MGFSKKGVTGKDQQVGSSMRVEYEGASDGAVFREASHNGIVTTDRTKNGNNTSDSLGDCPRAGRLICDVCQVLRDSVLLFIVWFRARVSTSCPRSLMYCLGLGCHCSKVGELEVLSLEPVDSSEVHFSGFRHTKDRMRHVTCKTYAYTPRIP